MGVEPAREAVARCTGRALRSERSAAAEHHGVQRGVGEGLAFADLAVAPGLVEGLDAGAGDVDEERGQWFGALADELGVQLLRQAGGAPPGADHQLRQVEGLVDGGGGGEVLAPPLPFVDGRGAGFLLLRKRVLLYR